MKKLFVVLIAFLSFSFAKAQDTGVKLGVHLDIPVGDASDITSIGFGGDIAYMFDISEEFKVGPSIGYLNYTGKKEHGEKRDNLGFVPIAGSAKYSLAENFFIGADLGYAIGVSPSYNKGGFYYLPKLGYQIDLFEAYVGYKGISNKFEASEDFMGSTFSVSKTENLGAIVIGFNYNF